MKKNHSSADRSAVFDRSLSLPHFDEEATLLSAQPVVPLTEVNALSRPKRRMTFGLTILAAILVGAIGATLLMQYRLNSQNAGEAEARQPTVSSSGAAGGSTSKPAENRLPVAREQVEEPQLGEVPSPRDSSKGKPLTAAVSHSSIRPKTRSSIEPARASSSDDERAADFENDERELRRAERRDARRDARRHRREQMGDDVLRIREIFEGAPRP